jgi:hypothetical protein
VNTPDWVVTAYAESQARPEVSLGSVNIPVGGPPFSADVSYTATITVQPFTLLRRTPQPEPVGYFLQISVTTFLDSSLRGRTT